MKYLQLFEEWARPEPNKSIREYRIVAGGSKLVGLERNDFSHSKITPEEFQQVIADAKRTKSPLDAMESISTIVYANPHLKMDATSMRAWARLAGSLTDDERVAFKNENDERKEIGSHFQILHDRSSSDGEKQKALDFFLARIRDKSPILLDYLHCLPSEAGKLLDFLPAEYHSQLEDFYGMESKEIRAVDLASEFGLI